jgi:flagellar hook assembly protein FlgD
VIPYIIPSLLVNASQSAAFVPLSTTLKVYNVRGQLVRTLVDQMKMPGEYRVIWNARDEKGNDVGSGVYFYKLEVENYQKTKAMIFIK